MKRYTLLLVLALGTLALMALEPPRNLTAIAGNGYVQLDWQPPVVNGMYEIACHDGAPFNGYVQLYEQGYGAIFDLSAYSGATLSQLDFRHSSYGVSGTWAYKVHLINWTTQQSIAVVEGLNTTGNDTWEEGIDLGDYNASDMVGVFIEPLGHSSDDAYPVMDCDATLDYTSYVIDLTNYDILTPNGAIGDFLIDLWITPPAMAAVPAPRAQLPSPHLRRATGVNTQQVRPHGQALPPSRELTGYKVYRNASLITETPLSYHLLTYTDTQVTNGLTYTYWITAYYDEGESSPSDTVEATPESPQDVLFYQGFESGSMPAGWVTHDEDGDYFDWEIAPSVVTGYQSSHCIWSQSYDNGAMQALSPDNWIVSPAIEITETCWLSFWLKTQDFDYPTEHIEVWVSTDSSDVEDFTAMLWEETTIAEGWHQASISLSDYVGQTCYFAWRHCDSYNNYAVDVDEVYVTTTESSGEETAPAPGGALRAWPNPFNPQTTIAFSAPVACQAEVTVYDIRGRRVAEVYRGAAHEGENRVVWHAEGMASGVYLARVHAGDCEETTKVLLLD